MDIDPIWWLENRSVIRAQLSSLVSPVGIISDPEALRIISMGSEQAPPHGHPRRATLQLRLVHISPLDMY